MKSLETMSGANVNAGAGTSEGAGANTGTEADAGMKAQQQGEQHAHVWSLFMSHVSE